MKIYGQFWQKMHGNKNWHNNDNNNPKKSLNNDRFWKLTVNIKIGIKLKNHKTKKDAVNKNSPECSIY